MQELPVLQQFQPVNFGPRFDEPLLAPRQVAANTLNRIEREYGLGILIRRMKVRPMVSWYHVAVNVCGSPTAAQVFSSGRRGRRPGNACQRSRRSRASNS